MVATLVRILGLRRVELAEDVVQDALCRALEVWKYRGVPDNPSAWLFQAARNRAVDLLRRGALLDRAAPRLATRLPETVAEADIRDDQLRMMFACAAPSLPPEARVAIILKYLCGFGVGEIAGAFLTSPAAVEKRLARAKRALKREAIADLPDATRLGSVQQALYLLFNEGYHGSHPERAVREELCSEALRLAALLSDHPATAAPSTFALRALLCLHAARLPSRIDDAGSLVLLEAQDRTRWSRPLLEEGLLCLARSAEGPDITPYHLEGAIAAHHARAASFAETDWAAIVDLYSKLFELQPTPVVALNRAIALGRVRGPDEGLRELERIRGGRRLRDYPFLEAATGDLHQRAGRIREAKVHFGRAVALARNGSERQILERRLAEL